VAYKRDKSHVSTWRFYVAFLRGVLTRDTPVNSSSDGESPKNWFVALSDGLKAQGFTQCSSVTEPCMFVKHDILVVIYVDDCIFVGKNNAAIDREINELKTKFDLDKEDDMAGFLGVAIETDKHGAKTLTQTGLIDRILLLMKLAESSGKDTPATNGTLGRDINGEGRKETWNCRSVLRMMLYLSSNSRPDIAFAVYQCGRYSTNPTLLHETAVKWIAQYLKQTRSRGMIISPKADLRLDLWVDADFAGLPP
jgi:hypothetical protein